MSKYLFASVAVAALLSAAPVAFAGAMEGDKGLSATAINSGTVGNEGDITVGSNLSSGTWNKGGIKGDAASATIAAEGASASISALTVNGDGTCLCFTLPAKATVSATNSGAITNDGEIKTGSLTGAGASLTVAAVGASASISISSISGGMRN